MTKKHDIVLRELTEEYQGNEDNIALIVCGSMARKDFKEDSDIDLYLVVSESEFSRINDRKSFFFGSWDPASYHGIEIDGKIVSIDYLRKAAKSANEATRYSFKDAFCLFSKNSEVENLIPQIYAYPEEKRIHKINAFWGYVKHFRYVGEEAYHSKDRFFWQSCVMNIVFYSGRLVLAHNRVFFPSHKALFKSISLCEQKPVSFIEESNALIQSFDFNEMIAYYEKINEYFSEYEHDDMERIGRILENEWTWYTGKLTVSEL